jgi:cell division protein FtsB
MVTKKKNHNKYTWLILANVVIIFLLVLAFGREYLANVQVQREISRLEERRHNLQADQAERLRMIQELSSEYYLERQAREKHGLAAEGERLIIVKNDSSESRINIETPEKSTPQSSNLDLWFYYFFSPDKLK